jgi:uncharacterized protein YaaQ
VAREGSEQVKLVIAIVQDKDAGRAVDELIRRGYGATRISTVGGFLRRGNATILTGVADEATPDVIQILHDAVGSASNGLETGQTAGVAFVLPVGASLKI